MSSLICALKVAQVLQRHDRAALARLQRAITLLLPETHALQLQEPITLMDGEPEPDATIFRGTPEAFRNGHPTSESIAIVVEVSDTTLPRDRGIKLRSYARAGIGTYWIINLIDRCVEVYTQPNSTADEPHYAPAKIHSADSVVPVSIDVKQVGEIRVADLLP